MLDLSTDMDEARVVSMTPECEAEGVPGKQLAISVHTVNAGSLDIYLYAPYWLINKTGLPLQFRVGTFFTKYLNACNYCNMLSHVGL